MANARADSSIDPQVIVYPEVKLYIIKDKDGNIRPVWPKSDNTLPEVEEPYVELAAALDRTNILNQPTWYDMKEMWYFTKTAQSPLADQIFPRDLVIQAANDGIKRFIEHNTITDAQCVHGRNYVTINGTVGYAANCTILQTGQKSYIDKMHNCHVLAHRGSIRQATCCTFLRSAGYISELNASVVNRVERHGIIQGAVSSYIYSVVSGTIEILDRSFVFHNCGKIKHANSSCILIDEMQSQGIVQRVVF